MVIIEINTENDAFNLNDTNSEIARILRGLADQMVDEGDNGRKTLRDINGNTVGHVIWTCDSNTFAD